MITVIENKGFIEAIFPSRKEAVAYLQDHPQRENCKLRQLKFSEFPFYFIEANDEHIYFATKDELVDYLKNMDTDKIGRTYAIHVDKGNIIFIFTKEKARVSTIYPLDKDDCIFEEELHLVIYKIREPFVHDEKNQDRMGFWDHEHIDGDMLADIKQGNMQWLDI